MPYSLFKKGIFSWLLFRFLYFQLRRLQYPLKKQADTSLADRQPSTVNPAICQQLSAGQSRQPISDSALLDLVQKQTFKYFWDFSHPVSGLARERSNTTPAYGNEVVTIGGSGFGVMAIIVATDRHWITRDTAVKHFLKSVKFLFKANSYHGIFPHWLNGATGMTIPFSRKDDGADIVETSYLFEGLFCARQYFNQNTSAGKRIAESNQQGSGPVRMELAPARPGKFSLLALESQ